MRLCLNFLRPTCSYTECQPSFQTGSCPTERTTVGYSSCFLDHTDQLPPSAVSIARWTLCRPWFPLVLLLMRLPKAPSFTGSFPEPCPAPVNIGNPARLWNHLHISAIVRNAAVSSACFSCRRMSLSILPKSYFVLSPRIVKIIRSILQAITISDCIFLSGFPPWLCNTGAVP